MPAVHPWSPDSAWPPEVWEAVERYAQALIQARELAWEHGGMELVPRETREQLFRVQHQRLEALRQALDPMDGDLFPYALADARRRRDYPHEPPIH